MFADDVWTTAFDHLAFFLSDETVKFIIWQGIELGSSDGVHD